MKNNVARQRSIQPTQEVATVIGVTGPTVRLRGSFGEAEARRAASCLLAPNLGDEVLAVFHERGAHVLAILERDAETPATLTNEGDLHISAGGRVVLHGADDPGLTLQRAADADAELAGPQRLADEVVGAELEAAQAILVGGAGRQEDEGHEGEVRVAADVLHQRPAVHLRHRDVGDDQVRRAVQRRREPLGAVRRGRHREAGVRERLLDADEGRGVVVDREDPRDACGGLHVGVCS